MACVKGNWVGFPCACAECNVSVESPSPEEECIKDRKNLFDFGCGCRKCSQPAPPPPRKRKRDPSPSPPPQSVLAKNPPDPCPRSGKCPWPGCDYSSKNSHLRVHYRIHTGEKPYPCTYEGCDKRFSHYCALVAHERAHSGENPYPCTFEGCGKRFTTSGNLTTHKRTHTGERPCLCTFEGCDKRFSTPGNLTNHERVHTGAKPYPCAFEGCGKRFSESGSLARHELVHTGKKQFKCDAKGCDYRAARSETLKLHFKSQHTPEGQKRQKRKEHRMFLALTKRDVVITDDDKQRHIDFSCIGGTCAYLDFNVYKEDRNVIVECMEDAHDYKPVQCDPNRAAQIFEAMAVAGNTLPVEFHFVNPDPFTVDGQPWKRKYETRMDWVAESIHAPAIPGIKPLSLVYWFYPIERGYPAVLWDKDYPKELRECVRCVN